MLGMAKPPSPAELANITSNLADLRITCTVCLVVSLLAALPIVVTGIVRKERRSFPSRISTIFMVKIMLMNVVVLLGVGVDYRIPSQINTILANMTSSSVMSEGWCKAQAISYQFLIWCVMSYWVVIAFCLCKVVTSAAEVLDFSNVERRCYWFVYGSATLFTVLPLILDQTVGNDEIFRADNNMLWCWLTAENSTKSGVGENFIPWSQVIFFYTFMLIYFAIGLAYSIKILTRLCGLRQGASSSEFETSHIITDYIVRHSMFIVVFLIVLGVVLAFAANETIMRQTGQFPEFILLKLHIIVVCSLGTWSFTVFGTSHQICVIWKGWLRQCFCCPIKNNNSNNNASSRSISGSLSEPLSSTLYTDDNNRTGASSFASVR